MSGYAFATPLWVMDEGVDFCLGGALHHAQGRDVVAGRHVSRWGDVASGCGTHTQDDPSGGGSAEVKSSSFVT